MSFTTWQAGINPAMPLTQKCGGYPGLVPGITMIAAYAARGRWRFGL
jgi:hypothetical protein